MNTCKDDDLGTAPKMPLEGTRVRIKPDEDAAVARQTLDEMPADAPAVRALGEYLVGMTGAVTRAAQTNGDIRPDGDNPTGRPLFAYGAQVERISEQS